MKLAIIDSFLEYRQMEERSRSQFRIQATCRSRLTITRAHECHCHGVGGIRRKMMREVAGDVLKLLCD